MRIPIVLTAFGTSTLARQTYQKVEAKVRRFFPEHPLRWAFTSRMVRDRLKTANGPALKHPPEVLSELESEGHAWAVVQSLHLICGHEFERLVCEVAACTVRTSIGLPLLDTPEDYSAVTRALDGELKPEKPDEALILVGHGTDHAAWAAYPALERTAQRVMSRPVFVGTVEGEPSAGEVVEAVARGGFRRVCLAPFLLVAGVHFQEDLAGREGSWKSLLESRGIEVRLEPRGLGDMPGIADIFCRHIAEALEVIPTTG